MKPLNDPFVIEKMSDKVTINPSSVRMLDRIYK